MRSVSGAMLDVRRVTTRAASATRTIVRKVESAIY